MKQRFKNEEDGKELLAVTVWQEMTYLVRCTSDKESAMEAVKDPVMRLAVVGEGQIHPQINKIEAVTVDILAEANPIK